MQFSAATGTTLNDPRCYSVASYRFQATTSNPSFELQLTRGSGGSLSDFIITYAARTDNGSGNTTMRMLHGSGAPTGINFSSAGVVQASSVTGNTWVSEKADFTGVTGVDNLTAGSTIYFEATLNGTYTEFFDNMVVQAVPEPVTQALVIFASLALLVSAGRWGVCRLKQAV